jgi:hypothetical protein
MDTIFRNKKIGHLKTIQYDFPQDVKIEIEKLKEKETNKENEDEE